MANRLSVPRSESPRAPAPRSPPPPLSSPPVDLPHYVLDARADGVEEGAYLFLKLPVVLSPRRRELVEAPGAALRMLPVPADQAARLELAQERIHRVRIDRENALGDLRDPLHQLVPVRRALGDEVQHQERQHVAPAELAREGIAERRSRRLDPRLSHGVARGRVAALALGSRHAAIVRAVPGAPEGRPPAHVSRRS